MGSAKDILVTTVECRHGGGHDWVEDESVERIAFTDINPYIGVSEFSRVQRQRCVHCGYLRFVETAPMLAGSGQRRLIARVIGKG